MLEIIAADVNDSIIYDRAFYYFFFIFCPILPTGR